LRRLITFVFAVIALATAAPAAYAEATRTWVSGVGDDANPCSRTAPCKTWAGAISKTATGGEIDALDPGGFGAVTITKSITIDGKGNIASALSGGTSAINVNGADIIVKLRHIEITGRTTPPGTIGVRIINAKTVLLDHVEIWGFASRGISFETTVNSTKPRLFVYHSDIHDNAARGLFMQPNAVGATATIVDTEFESNGGGIAIDSVNATNAANPVRVSLRRVTTANNDDFGLLVKGNTQANVFLEECDSLNNVNAGISADQGAHVFVSNSLIAGNGIALSFTGVGTTLQSRQNNTVVGNTSLGTGFSGTFAGL
jgi:hypothetical protein